MHSSVSATLLLGAALAATPLSEARLVHYHRAKFFDGALVPFEAYPSEVVRSVSQKRLDAILEEGGVYVEICPTMKDPQTGAVRWPETRKERVMRCTLYKHPRQKRQP